MAFYGIAFARKKAVVREEFFAWQSMMALIRITIADSFVQGSWVISACPLGRCGTRPARGPLHVGLPEKL